MIWRWLKVFLLVICAMVAVAAGFEHWRSHRLMSVGHYYGEKSWVGFQAVRGDVVVAIGRDAPQALIKWDYHERPLRSTKYDVNFEGGLKGGTWMGFGYYQDYSPRRYYLLFPIWAVWALAAAPVMVALWRTVRKKRRKKGNLCVGCGYDLRGSAERCPECGADLAYLHR